MAERFGKNRLLVAMTLFFIAYTLGVVQVTLRIGYDVFGIEPNWLDLALFWAFTFVVYVPICALIVAVFYDIAEGGDGE